MGADVAQMGFGDLHIFSYSPRRGTLAATMPDQVPTAVKRARSQALHALARRLRREHLAQQVGRIQPVLIEGFETAGDGLTQVGYTPSYLLVRVPTGGADLSNRILPVRIERVIDEAEHGPPEGNARPPGLLLGGMSDIGTG
jgi:threonylcarbamoyladenosine tRNA methylthiotransferase MtaB